MTEYDDTYSNELLNRFQPSVMARRAVIEAETRSLFIELLNADAAEMKRLTREGNDFAKVAAVVELCAQEAATKPLNFVVMSRWFLLLDKAPPLASTQFAPEIQQRRCEIKSRLVELITEYLADASKEIKRLALGEFGRRRMDYIEASALIDIILSEVQRMVAGPIVTPVLDQFENLAKDIGEAEAKRGAERN